MKGFFRPASQSELSQFKKALDQWGHSKGGVLTPQIGTDAEISSCDCCDFFSIEVDTLFEKRALGPVETPSKRGSLPLTSAVAYGQVDIWSKPTPPVFKAKFETNFEALDTPGTDVYKSCSGCSEKGAVKCHSCTSGRVNCDSCGGQKRVDCHGCNGYGYLECSRCTQGQVETACGGCQASGTNSCDGCGGRGYILNSHTDKYDPCRSCNQTGTVTCRACGGGRYKWSPCQSCHGGRVDCRTCRGQKILECRSCEADGKNTCGRCSGSASVQCVKCHGQGGFKQKERLMLTTEIAGLGVKVIHPMPQPIPVKLSFNGLDFVQSESLTSEMIVQRWKHADLQNEILNRFQDWKSKKPQTALMDRIRVLQTAVLEVKFKVQGVEGRAFFECSSGEIQVIQDPIANVIQSTQDSLKTNFDRAFRKKEYANAESILAKAKEFNFDDFVSKWRQQIDKSKEQDRIDANQKFIWTKKLPLLLGLGPLLWLILGFIVPVNLFALVIMTFISWKIGTTTSVDLTADLTLHQKELKKALKKSAVVLILFAVLVAGWSTLVIQYGVERALDTGVKLTGRK